MTGLPTSFYDAVISTFRNLFNYVFVLLLILTCIQSGYASDKPQLQLAQVYDQRVDVGDYWVSEKLDGVRGHWNGKQLISRQGHVFSAPSWFIAGFPAIPMDGELWIARGKFDKVSGVVRQKRKNNLAWSQVKFMLFDLPNSQTPFTETLAQMQRIVAQSSSKYLHLVEQRRLSDNQQLNAWLENVVALGGEGLMLRLADGVYQPNRNANLLKLKQYQDAEAVVLAYLPGKGKYKGQMGAIRVRDELGIEFKIGSGFSDQQRLQPPPIGSIITFKYYGKTANHVPRFASFLRVRKGSE